MRGAGTLRLEACNVVREREVVVRLALVLNKTGGANLTESEAVQAFIEQEVVPKTQDIVDEWQGWRER